MGLHHGVILQDYIKEVYYGTILWNHILESSCGIWNRITETHEGIILWNYIMKASL